MSNSDYDKRLAALEGIVRALVTANEVAEARLTAAEKMELNFLKLHDAAKAAIGVQNEKSRVLRQIVDELIVSTTELKQAEISLKQGYVDLTAQSGRILALIKQLNPSLGDP